MIRWVDQNAGGQSRALASADFASRTFNSMLLGYDDIHVGIQELQSNLLAIAQASRSTEERALRLDATSAALFRGAQAQLLLDQLISVRAKAATVHADFDKVTVLPDRTAFILAGLYHVGIDTLFESFSQMGDASKSYLPARYGIRVSVVYDGDGNYKDTHFDVPKSNDYEGAAVTIVYALAQSYPWARYLLYAYAVFKGGQAIDEEQACLRSIADQKDKVHEALLKLPSVLPKTSDLYQIFASRWSDSAAAFSKHSGNVKQALDAIDIDLQQQVALQFERIAAAHQILTAEKITVLRRQILEGDARFSNLIDDSRAARVASQLGLLRSRLQQHRIQLMQASNATTKASALEKLQDWATYDAALVASMRSSTALVTLQSAFDDLEREVENAEADAAAAKRKDSLRMDAPRADRSRVRFDMSFLALEPFSSKTWVHSKPAPNIGRLYQVSSVAPEIGICGLVTADGEVYRCGNLLPGERNYRSEFNDGYGDAFDDASRGAGDGGYERDNRRTLTEIADIQQNITDRTNYIYQRLRRAEQDLPEWIEHNGNAVSNIANAAAAESQQISADRAAFEGSNSALVQQSKEAITKFLSTGLDDVSVGTLVAKTGAANLALPSISPADIPADVTDVLGVIAPDRAFQGTTDTHTRAVMHERLKAIRDIGTDSAALQLSGRICAVAQSFFQFGGSGGQQIGEAILEDASSVRFAKQRLLRRPTETELVGGSLQRKSYDQEKGVPASSIFIRAEQFNAALLGFSARSALFRSSLPREADDYSQRLDGIHVASSIAATAAQTFYSGDLSNGETLLKMAQAVLDVSTRFVPGVNLGRDIYEAVTGRDLFTGQTLDNLGRTAAVLGVVSLGLFDDVKGGFQALRLLANEGVALERAEHILQSSRTLKSAELMERLSPHAIEEMASEPLGEISRSEIANTIDEGTHFWDTQRRSVVAFENNVAPGEVRVAVAIDIDDKVVKTVFRKEANDVALSAETWKDPALNGALRNKFIKLPAKR